MTLEVYRELKPPVGRLEEIIEETVQRVMSEIVRQMGRK